MTGLIIAIIIIAALGCAGVVVYKKFQEEVVQKEEKERYVPTTQDKIPIDYVRDGVLKMKNGSYVAIVSVPSLNIDLMEGEEKEVVLQQYRKVLNAIDFSFQFLQQSRVVDISDYLKKIEQVKDESENIFVQKQLAYYSSFLVDLIQTRSVLTKKFYVAIAYDSKLEKLKTNKNKTSSLNFETKKKKATAEEERNDVLEEEKEFNIARKELEVRAGNIVSLFSGLGVNPERIHDDEIVELFYTSYNKNRSVYQGLPKNINENSTTLRVKRG